MGNAVPKGYSNSRDFKFNIDMTNLKKSRSQWKRIEHAYVKGFENGIIDFGEKLKAHIMGQLVIMGLGSSELMNEIEIITVGDGTKITVGSDYAIYVEFGTGIVGEGTHPKPMAGWIYDVNGHGESGWYYPTTSGDPNPWKHTYQGQLYAFTKGQKARPFMYNSWLWGKRSFTQIIDKNINAEVRKVNGVR